MISKVINLAREIQDFVRSERAKFRTQNATSQNSTPHSADLVSGHIHQRDIPLVSNVPYRIHLERREPGGVFLRLEIGGRGFATIPFDNLVKTMIRIDPEHADGPQREIAKLRRELSKTEGRLQDVELELQRLVLGHRR